MVVCTHDAHGGVHAYQQEFSNLVVIFNNILISAILASGGWIAKIKLH